MAKRKSQGIGLIDSYEEFQNLQRKILSKLYNLEIYDGWNNAKKNSFIAWINASTGRSSGEETITDFYQVMFCTFLPSVHTTGRARTYNNEFSYEEAAKKTNTLIAKLATEGQYGNTGIVRRQTTLTKLKQNLQERSRVISSENAFDSYEKLSNRMGGLNRLNLSSLQLSAISFAVDKVLALRAGRGRRRASTTTRRATTTPTTPTTTTTTLSARDRLEQGLVKFNQSNTPLEGFRHVAGSFNAALEMKLDELETPSISRLAFMTFEFVFFDVFSRRLGGRVSESKHQILKNDLRVIAFVISGYNPKIARDLSDMTLFPRGERREFTAGKFTRMCKDIYMGVSSNLTEIATNLSKIVTNGAVEGRLADWNEYRQKIIRAYETANRSVLPTIRSTRINFGIIEDDTRTTQVQTTPTQVATPTQTQPPTQTPPPSQTLIRESKVTDAFDFGIEWEHFGLSMKVLKEVIPTVMGQKIYPNFYPSHEFHTSEEGRRIKKGLFPDGKINKGWWVMMVDGSVDADRNEPPSEFRNRKEEARMDRYPYTSYRGELVSPVLGGKKGLEIIRKLGDALVAKGMRHNRTTGMHTHITKKGFNDRNIRNLMYNYMGMERIIEGMFEPNRRGRASYNKPYYAKGLGYTYTSGIDNVKGTLRQMVLDASDDVFRRRFEFKTQPVNLLAYYTKNTIEFRSHGGNYEGDTVSNWILFLFYFMEFSKKYKFKTFTWDSLTKIMPVGLASFWYNRIQDLTGKSPYDISWGGARINEN